MIIKILYIYDYNLNNYNKPILSILLTKIFIYRKD